MPVNFKLRAIARERERVKSAHTRARERERSRRDVLMRLDFTSYKVLIIMLVINVYGRFVLYFHLHYQVIPNIACVFSKP